MHRGHILKKVKYQDVYGNIVSDIEYRTMYDINSNEPSTIYEWLIHKIIKSPTKRKIVMTQGITIWPVDIRFMSNSTH